MKVQIRPTALEDLSRGYRFYNMQELGVGAYFFDSVSADIDSLALYAGVHPKVFGYYRMLTRRFPYAVYYGFEKMRSSRFGVFWIFGEIRSLFAGRLSRSSRSTQRNRLAPIPRVSSTLGKMNVLAITKGAIVAGWALPAIAIGILFFPASYRGGYEDRTSDAALLLMASVALMLGATGAAILLRGKSGDSLSKSWLGFAAAHLVVCLAFVAYFASLLMADS